MKTTIAEPRTLATRENSFGSIAKLPINEPTTLKMYRERIFNLEKLLKRNAMVKPVIAINR